MPVSDQGSTDDRYTLIPRTLIFLTRCDSVLLLKGAPSKKLYANLYNGIGGHVEPGEDILSAAQRELDEETGLTVDDLWHCGTITIDTGKKPGICVFLFLGESKTGRLKESNEGSPAWVPISGISELPLVEDLYTILPRVLGQKMNDPPLSVQYSYDEEDQLVINFGG